MCACSQKLPDVFAGFHVFCQTAVDALPLLPIQKGVLVEYSTYQLAKGWVPSRLLAFDTLMYVNRLI